MIKQKQYIPDSIVHAGEILEEKIAEMGMSIKEFALRTEKPQQTILAVIKGESAITNEMALKFETVTQIPFSYWMSHQLKYDELKTRKKFKTAIKDAEPWAKKFPYTEMAKNYRLPETKKLEEKTQNLFHFFAIASHNAWENLYLKSDLKTAAYASLKHTQEPHAISAWLRQGEIQATKVAAPKYDKAVFKGILPKIKKVMEEHPHDYFDQLKALCLRAGVKLVFTPKLPKVPINGSTRWLNDTPLIQLTARYRQNDKFWFTFFHEAGHILLHGKKYISLENIDFSEADQNKEQEAHRFAEEWTFSKQLEKELLKRESITIDDVLEFAKKDKTHPAMIIGRLQHLTILHFSQGKEYFIPIQIDELN